MRIFIVLLLFTPITLFGQGFGGGIYGGISTSQVSGDGIGGFHKVGGWAGAFTDYRFTPRSALQFEISFIQKGSRQTPTVKNNSDFRLHNHNMIEVPIIYRWYGIKNMSIEIGTQVGIILSTLDRIENISENSETRNNPAFKKAEWSGAAGLSYYFWKSKIEVNMRYSNSIIPLKTQQFWMNHVFAFSVRYWFKTTLNRDKINATKKKNLIEVKIE
jgi:hypothetical protein